MENADIATDIPRYRIYEKGILTKEVEDASPYWRDDLVSFLIGCSFSFEGDLLAADVPVRQIEEGCNVPMYNTNIPCRSAGIFHGNMVVSMRPIPYELVPKAVLITGAMPKVHGAPIHIGDPSHIGIADLDHPDYGDDPGRRGSCLLAVRRNTAERDHAVEAGLCDHTCAGTYVHYRCEERKSEVLRL